MLRFNKDYFLLSVALLLTEILIARYVHDSMIRPYGGDFLVVVLLYCLVMTFLNVSVVNAAAAVLLFSCVVEWTQYIKLADRLQLAPGSLSRVLLGDYFSWTDIGCYAMGICAVLIVEQSS
jgi:hypothetical protein